jgi:4-amino-4-deoxy-L-arabinose transferase-like glycosyltransferase
MPAKRFRLRAGLLLACTVGFALLGQFYFSRRREYVWDGITFFAVALLCFAGLLLHATHSVRARRQVPRPGWRDWGRRLSGEPRAILIVLAVLINWIAARYANTQPPPAAYTLSVLLWLASLLLLFAAFIPFAHMLRTTRHTLRNPKHAIRTVQHTIRRDPRLLSDLALVSGLILLGLVLRLWDLGHIPANLSGDEGTQGLWAVDVLRGRLRNPFATGWFTVPTMSFFAQAASLRLFGDNVAGLRTLSALIGTTTLLFTYLLARRSLGRRVALFALAALTFNHYHIHFSRLGSNQIADPFFMALSLWLLTEALRRAENRPGASSLWFLAAGLAIGLSWYGYFGSRVIVLVVAAYLGLQSILERGFLRRHARGVILMALMAVMAASPLLLYYLRFPDNLSARFNQVNFFRWLENELSRPDHASTFELIVRQVWRSISAFNYTLDPTFWYRAQIPLLDFVSGILFLLGMVAALSQWRKPAVRLILLWFGLALTFGWILTENPPSSMRMVIIAPAVALLVALGLDRLLMVARWATGGHQVQWEQFGYVVLALTAVLNVYYYFIVYTPTRVYGNPTAETGTVMARYLNERWVELHPSAAEISVEGDTQPFVYFYGPPFMYYDFGTIQFIARHVPGVSVPPLDQDPNFRTRVSRPTIFVVLRERLDELETILNRHPNGRLSEFQSSADGRLMFVVYELSQ